MLLEISNIQSHTGVLLVAKGFIFNVSESMPVAVFLKFIFHRTSVFLLCEKTLYLWNNRNLSEYEDV